MTPSNETADVASFYHLREVSLEGRACAGTACFVARFLDPERWQKAVTGNRRVYCLGKCHVSPSVAADRQRPAIRVVAPRPVVLERLVDGAARTLAGYRSRGGYRALDRALGMAPGYVIDEVD